MQGGFNCIVTRSVGSVCKLVTSISIVEQVFFSNARMMCSNYFTTTDVRCEVQLV